MMNSNKIFISCNDSASKNLIALMKISYQVYLYIIFNEFYTLVLIIEKKADII